MVDFRGRGAVDVETFAERFGQFRVIAERRKQPEFDLRIISRQNHTPLVGNESPAHFPAGSRADRDVLQVRIGRRQASCSRHRLVESGVHLPCCRINKLRQRIDVGRQKFFQTAGFKNQPYKRMRGPVLLQNLFGCGEAPFFCAFGFRVEFQLPEQHLADLHRRTDIEFLTGKFISLLLNHTQFVSQLHRLPVEFG